MIRTHEKTKGDIHRDRMNKELCLRRVVTSERRTRLSGQCEVRHVEPKFRLVGANTFLDLTLRIPSTVLLSHVTAKTHKVYRIRGYPQTWILLDVSAINRHPQRDFSTKEYMVLLHQSHITTWKICNNSSEYSYVDIMATSYNKPNRCTNFSNLFLE